MDSKVSWGIFIFWAILILLVSTRVFFSLHKEKPDIGSCLKQNVHGIATISEDPERKEGSQVLVLEAKEMFSGLPSKKSDNTSDTLAPKSCVANIFIRAKAKAYPRYEYGEAVTFSGKLSAPYNFSSDDGRVFDYKGYLAKNDIFYEIKSVTLEKIIAREPENITGGNESMINGFFAVIEASLYKIKHRFVNNLEQVLGEPHAALASGLVVGEKSSLGAQLLQDFRTVGLIHIVVLSGFNITIVADALRRMLSRLPRMWGITIGGIGMILFGVLVGGGATVVRSCFMASIALVADISRRSYDVLRALIFAALIMLIQNPDILLHDPSFQLSFLATLGLILLASPIEKRIQWIPDKFGMRGTIASTFATQIFVSPFILYMMGQLSIIGVVVNILVLPFIPVTMLAVFLAGATGFVFTLGSQVFGWVAHILLSYELLMVQSFAKIPFASIHLPIFSGWYVVAFYIIFGVIYFVIKRLGKTKTLENKV